MANESKPNFSDLEHSSLNPEQNSFKETDLNEDKLKAEEITVESQESDEISSLKDKELEKKYHSHNKKNTLKRSNNRFVALCVAPACILFFIFMVLPTLKVFFMSFFKVDIFSKKNEFIGFQNFKALFADDRFVRASQNTILLVVIVTIVTMFFALFYASCLIREKIRGKNFLRVVFYIPNILSVVVIAGIFSAIYDIDNGLLNSFLSLFTAEKVSIIWKSESNVMISLIIAMIWQAIGYYMVMYMSAISAIPESIYESASIDGANKFVQFFKMTIPLIWTNIRTTLTFFIISTINMSFLFVKAMTSGGPNGSSEVILSFMYNQKDAGLFGYCMAIGVVIFIFSFALSALVNKFTYRDTLEF